MTNLMEGLQQELNRCRELKQTYDAIPTGLFGSGIIKLAIEKAEKAISDDDIVQMVVMYKELKGLE